MAGRATQRRNQSLQESVMRVMRKLGWEPRVRHTESAAKRATGLRVVTDDKAKLADLHERGDRQIAEAAVRVLRWNRLLPDDIEVEVDHGFVTLRGEVDWRYQRDAAKRAVRYLVGVTGVANQIQIKSDADEPEIEGRIGREPRRFEMGAPAA
jgi:osmotically-inducible protein OsmY